MKRILAFLLVAVLLAAWLPGCAPKASSQMTYTYRISTERLPEQWSAHNLTTVAAIKLQSLLYAPLCELTVASTATGAYQWIFVAAEEILDVTKENTADLKKYGSVVPGDETPERGYVYEIRLRKEMQWEDGTAINADTYLYSLKALLDPEAGNAAAASFFSGKAALAGAKSYGTSGGSFEKKVGFYKVDDYTLRYVCLASCSAYDLYSLLSTSFLVHPEKYAASGAAYATTADTTVSCGPYRIQSITPGKQIVLAQNKRYWEYGESENGEMRSVTFFDVDGKKQSQFRTQRIIITGMTGEETAEAYRKGQLDLWTPSDQTVAENLGSDRLYIRAQTFTVRLFFHTDLQALQALDGAGKDSNAVVLSSDAFRKAMSLAVDRESLARATAGYVPTLSLISSLSYYDVQNDPESLYCYTDAALKALCDRYGVEWDEERSPEGKRELYTQITGYDPEQAKQLMAEACRELSEAGLYTPGEAIQLRVAWKSSELDDLDRQQVRVLNDCLNAAAKDSGFGQITLIPVGNLEDRYEDVSEGGYAVGLGAWGGSVFQPFGVARLYCDPVYADPLHEAGCWDPSTEQLTLTVDGQEYTMTWQAWSNSMTGSGQFAELPMEAKLELLATMEKLYLERYYSIPLMNTADCYLLSGKLHNFTHQYNVLYGFGGLRLMQYDYTDQQWEEYIQSCNADPYAPPAK